MKTATTVLILCVGGLLGLGMVMLYSSGLHRGGAHYLLLQAAWGSVGLIGCVIAAAVDYRQLKKISWMIYLLIVVLLVLVLIPGIGLWRGGARRWFNLGVGSFQPSEAAKLALILILAWYGDRYQRLMPTFLRGLAVPCLIIAPVLGLIFVEPDRGTTILLAVVSCSLLFLAGVKLQHLLPPAMVAAAGLCWSLWHDPVRWKRIMSWFYESEHRQGTGYQSYQATLALGSGGPTGVGLGNGRQKLGFVPEAHTDFIFSVVGEELGLVATMAVLVAFILFIWCGIYIASKARDTFGFLLASGITLLIGMQAWINIGVVTNTLPNKGLALPFISYGGSSLVLMLVSVGVLLSVARHNTDESVEEETVDFEGTESHAIG
ncbi:MAG: putative lipid II flippase FtsW [Verrucomicrobiota bacterium]|nr:putative lipid II flippase FtsW [Verrucomicrobiota bacterium]